MYAFRRYQIVDLISVLMCLANFYKAQMAVLQLEVQAVTN